MPEDKIKLDAGTVLPENLIITEEFRKLNNLIENTSSNMFITGKAGCGKSTLLEYFRQNTVKNYVILAYTGITALKQEVRQSIHFLNFHPD